jgi:hypothetical protein
MHAYVCILCDRKQNYIDQPMYLYNERTALDRLRSILVSNLTKGHPTTEEEDTVRLAFLRDELGAADSSDSADNAAGDDSAEDGNWKLLCALTYRITRKKILKNAILLLEELIDWVDKILTNKNQVR